MSPAVVATLAALALAQAPAAAPPQAAAAPPAPTAASATVPPPAAPAEPVLPARMALVAPGSPALRWGVPSRCLVTPAGRFRAQCDPATRRCLVAPDATLASNGRAIGPLERAEPCRPPAVESAEVSGFELVPALAESPPGVRRDERQRASQLSFDMSRRIWLGGGWAWGGLPWSNQAVVSAGLRYDYRFVTEGVPAVVRIRALDGWTTVNGTAAEINGISLDYTRAYPQPFLRITTLVGRPRRFDVPLYLGWWIEGLRYESLKTRSGVRYERSEAAVGALTFDLWRRADLADLTDFLRLKVGGGYEEVTGRKDGDWPLILALEGDARLDRDGLHQLRGSIGADLILPKGAGPAAPLPRRRQRLTGRLEYEWVLFSVNDQPASLVLAAAGRKRDDVPDWPTGWVGELTAQLRLSLWAPPLRGAPVQEALER